MIKVSVPSVIMPKTLFKLSRERRWIQRVVEFGLPDGRKRFLFHVLIPYLAVVRQLSEKEVLRICHDFLENSCKNHGKCDKVHNSWIRSSMGSARSKGFRGFSLQKLRERCPDLYLEILSALSSHSSSSNH